MFTMAKELNIPPHELMNYPVSLVKELMLVFTEIKTYEAELVDKATSKAKTGKSVSSKDGVNFG
jgi:hypothetical protein